jgi:glutamine synthetase
MFEEANLAVDHNSLLMDVMDRVSSKHKLKVLFHEKPFAGINGSGKHNNWSMGTGYRGESVISRKDAKNQPAVPDFLYQYDSGGKPS